VLESFCSSTKILELNNRHELRLDISFEILNSWKRLYGIFRCDAAENKPESLFKNPEFWEYLIITIFI
jgi:hypothetical protein